MSYKHEYPLGSQNGMITTDKHLLHLERAALLRSGAHQAGSIMTIDEAYGVVNVIDDAKRLPAMSLATLTANDVYHLSEALDTVLRYDALNPDPTAKITNATMAADLYGVLPYASDPETKQTILKGVLGIDVDSRLPIPQQIAERYFVVDGSAEERTLAIDGIVRGARTLG